MSRNKYFKYVFLVWLCSQCGWITAQNPFDLQHRIEEGKVEITPQLNPNNPFEKELTVTMPTPEQKVSKGIFDAPLEKQQSASSGQFKFWLMTISLILLTVLFTLYKSLVNKIYRAFINENFLKLIHRNEGRIVSVPYLLLYGLALLNMAAFVYAISDHFGWLGFGAPSKSFFIILLGIVLIFLIKHFALILAGGIFPISKVLRQYSFTIIVFNIILGMVLIPFNLFIAFAEADLARVLIYVALTLVSILYLYRAFRGLLIAGKHLSIHKFHFFMYLCTVEIAPVFLLIRLITLAHQGYNQ